MIDHRGILYELYANCIGKTFDSQRDFADLLFE